MKHGILLTNIGSPNTPSVNDVNRYLREFLTDKRVINLPTLLRYLLTYGLIVPFRTKKSALAYQLIWTKQGSPLLVHHNQLVTNLQKEAGEEYKIALGMRYGKPSIAQAINNLKECASITVLPLYPQYSSAATGSTIEEIMRVFANQEVIPSLTIIRDFYQHPAYITAQAQIINTHFNEQDHLLFSYHGIPEHQIQKSGCKTICSDICPPISENNQGCYKAQCHQTSLLLATELKLKPNQYSTAFQSRLGKTPWIKPYLDEILIELVVKGINNLTVVCPSFIADCLETLEEIGIRAKEQWIKLGGIQFTMIPCLNSDACWVKAVVQEPLWRSK
jgi:ferrochelatase